MWINSVLAFFILLFVFYPISCNLSGCPVDYDLDSPCECLDPFEQVFFTCRGIKSQLEIQTAMRNMAGRHIGEFILRDSDLRYVPFNLFVNTTVSRIKIFKTNLFYLFDRPLEGGLSNSLNEVVLEDVIFHGGFDWDVLENLGNLQVLNLQRVDLYQIPSVVRTLELPVETLIVSNGSLMLIFDKVFRRFENLKNLKLDQNELKSFSRKILPYPETKLQHLDISFNKLSCLPEDMFEGTPFLSSVLLKGNNFNILEETYFSKIWNQLFYFDISDNPLTCDCHIRWIVKKERPFHLYGSCASTAIIPDKSLINLSADDFNHCE